MGKYPGKLCGIDGIYLQPNRYSGSGENITSKEAGKMSKTKNSRSTETGELRACSVTSNSPIQRKY